ncbi:acyl-CoA thioesterase [Ruminococcaceae bacterium OttesenSCG-928-L11]|nr:acyl-CoA thioesterase [Ruminococcaceae bacterium OttesenSCG-928-L11]
MEKHVKDSMTEQSRIVRPSHLNGAGRLFGGQLALWIDEVAGIAAIRHCQRPIVTAAIDNLRFREAVLQNQLVVLIAKVTYVGSTSMEVRVDSYVEDLSGARKLINTAFLTQVALDDAGKPTKVPQLICESAQETAEFEAGRRRREMRLQMKADLYG